MCLSDRDIICLVLSRFNKLVSNPLEEQKIEDSLRHIKSCEECRNKVERYRKMLDESTKLLDEKGG